MGTASCLRIVAPAKRMGKGRTGARNAVVQRFVSTGNRKRDVRSARVRAFVNTAKRDRNVRSARVLAFVGTANRDRNARSVILPIAPRSVSTVAQ